jgi:hypothetical protein
MEIFGDVMSVDLGKEDNLEEGIEDGFKEIFKLVTVS